MLQPRSWSERSNCGLASSVSCYQLVSIVVGMDMSRFKWPIIVGRDTIQAYLRRTGTWIFVMFIWCYSFVCYLTRANGCGPNYGIYSFLARWVREMSANYGPLYLHLMIVSNQFCAAHTYSAVQAVLQLRTRLRALAPWSRYVAQVCHAIIPSAMSASDTQCWWPITFVNDSIESNLSGAYIFCMYKQCYSFVSDLVRVRGKGNNFSDTIGTFH